MTIAPITPNIQSNPHYDAQAEFDATDQGLFGGIGTGVLSGCVVSPTSPTPTYAVVVQAGGVTIQNRCYGTVGVTLAPAAPNVTDRKDIVLVGTSGIPYIKTGTPCAVTGWNQDSPFLPPVKPAVDLNTVLLAELYILGDVAPPYQPMTPNEILSKIITPPERGGVIVANTLDDNATDNTAIINATIYGAYLLGGGTIRIPFTNTGIVLHGGTILHYSNVQLVVDDAVTIRWTSGSTGGAQWRNAAYATTARGAIDAQMVAGSSTVTSPVKAQFTNADTGKPVTVWGAAYNNGPLTGTATYVSATHITLTGRTCTDGVGAGTTSLTSLTGAFTKNDIGQTITEPGNTHIAAGTTIVGVAPGNVDGYGSAAPSTAILSQSVSAGTGITFTIGCQAITGTNCAPRTVADGVITTGPLGGLMILTSATANFTPMDTGSYVTVAGSGLPTTGILAQMFYVNSTTVSLNTIATTPVTGATVVITPATYMSIGPLDTNISVMGGTWDQGQVTNSPGTAGSVADFKFYYARVNGIRLNPTKVTSEYSEFASNNAIIGGDCHNVEVGCDHPIEFGVQRVAVYFDSPFSNVHVGTVKGYSGDDFLAIGQGSYFYDQVTIGEMGGYFIVDNFLAQGSRGGIAIYGQRNYWPMQHIKIGHFLGSNSGDGYDIRIVAAAQGGIFGTNVQGLTIDTYEIVPTSAPRLQPHIYITGAYVQDMRIGDVVNNNPNAALSNRNFMQVDNGARSSGAGGQQFVSHVGNLSIGSYRDLSGTNTGAVLLVNSRVDSVIINSIDLVCGSSCVFQTQDVGSIGDAKIVGYDITGNSSGHVVVQNVGGWTDGVTDGTTANFYSQYGQFTSADVGLTISEAGNTHIAAGTTILSVQSPYQCTLSQNTVLSGTGVTYVLQRPMTMRMGLVGRLSGLASAFSTQPGFALSQGLNNGTATIFNASGTYIAVNPGVYEIEVTAGGGASGGAGSASGAVLQAGSGAGGRGGTLKRTVTITVPNDPITVTVGAGGTHGTGGAPGGNPGAAGTSGQDSTVTDPHGIHLVAWGGNAGAPSAANSTTVVGGGLPAHAQAGTSLNGDVPGAGGKSAAQGNPGDSGPAAGGGGGGGASTLTNGGGPGNAGSLAFAAVPGTSGASSTADGENGASAAANSGAGAGGAGGGAQGGKGGDGGDGGSGVVTIKQVG